jgi:Flp pilus assembly protein TadD
LRLGNAVLSYALYLGKAVWPINLAIIYPMPGRLSWAEVALAGVFLLVVTLLVWRARLRCPYLIVGWLWFVGMLLPVSGLVQNYGEAYSDRFTYLPLVGVFIAVAFGMRDLLARFQIGVVPPAAAAGLVLGSCLLLTEHQLSYWRNSETLFSRAIAVTKDNFLAHNNLGVALATKNRQAEALANFQEAIRINPRWADLHNNLGNVLRQTGRFQEALVEYRKAIQLNPNLPAAHKNSGEVLVELGRFQEAVDQLSQAARLDSTDPWAHWEMADALLKQGYDAEAIDQLRETLRLEPDDFQVLTFTAHVLAADENPEVRDGKTALVLAEKACSLTDGNQPNALDYLGMAFAETGDFTNAEAATLSALKCATAAKMTNLEPLRQRLELYRKRQAWRESFLFTNTPSKEVP